MYFIVVFDSKADKQGRRSFPRPIHRTLRGPRQLIVVWVIFRTRIDGPIRSAHPDSARVTTPPRRPNFAKNMHPDKWCRPSESGHTRVPRRRSWCCSGVAAAVVRYCTHSLCRRHGRMVLWCTIHCVNCECSLFLLVLCERWVSVRMYSHTIEYISTYEFRKFGKMSAQADTNCSRHLWRIIQNLVLSSSLGNRSIV